PDLVTVFENRGYVLSDHPDFAVAYYASASEKLDVAEWDYGYRYDPLWWSDPGPYPPAVTYTEGTVIVDVINPSTKELLWRGQGVARVSDDQGQYEQDLGKTVTAILDKFPRAAGGSSTYPPRGAAGSVNRMVAPGPSFGAAQIFPPCISTIERLTESP